MCKGSSTVRWLPHFLVSTAAGPACALSWWRWILALDAFGQSLTDWIWLVQAQWQINCTWSVAETIIRPGESGLDSTRLDSARQILSVWTDDDDNNQIWHDHIDHDMIWHDQLVQLKVPRIVLHITETHLTHRNRWMWSRCSTHGTESRWARWTIDIHRHPSTWTNTSWTVVQRCAALNICWAEVDHMPWNVGKEGRAWWRQNETNIGRTSTQIMKSDFTSYNNLQ